MDFIQLQEADKAGYNKFVAEHQGDSFLQSWDWGDWQIELGKTVARYALVENDNFISTMQVITLAPTHFPVLYAPRGPVFAPSAPKIKIVERFAIEIQKKYPRALALRIEPERTIEGLSKLAKKTLPSQPEKTMTLDLHKPADEILGAMHEKTRYNIRLAEKKGVAVLAIPAQELSDEQIAYCITLLQETAKRQNFRNHTTIYLEKFLQHFRSSPKDGLSATVYFASFEDALITAAVMIDFGQTRMYLYGGSSELHRNVMAPYLLHWKAITDAQGKNIHWYDLGGSETVSGKSGGFTRFKSGFRGSEIEYGGTWDIPLKRLLYPAYALSRKANRIRTHVFKKSGIIN